MSFLWKIKIILATPAETPIVMLKIGKKPVIPEILTCYTAVSL